MSWLAKSTTLGLFVGGLLIAVLAVQLRSAPEAVEPEAPKIAAATDQAPQKEPSAPFSLSMPRAFSVMAERPLFMATRRPPPPPEAPPPPDKNVPAAKPPAPQLVVTAIVRDGARRLALVGRNKRESPVEVEVGGRVHGWTVEGIEHDHVVVRAGAREDRIWLRPPSDENRQ